MVSLLVIYSGVLLRRQTEASGAWDAYKALVSALLEHTPVMSASLICGLCLIYLHLLYSAKRVFGP